MYDKALLFLYDKKLILRISQLVNDEFVRMMLQLPLA